MMLLCKAVFIKLLLSRSNRQAPMQDTGQIVFLYSAEVFCKKLGSAMEIMSLKSQSVPCEELIEGGDEANPLSKQQPWLSITNICLVLPQYISPVSHHGAGKHWCILSPSPWKSF